MTAFHCFKLGCSAQMRACQCQCFSKYQNWFSPWNNNNNRKPFGNTRSDHVASAALHNEFLFGQSSGGRPVRRSVLRHSNINILFDRKVSSLLFPFERCAVWHRRFPNGRRTAGHTGTVHKNMAIIALYANNRLVQYTQFRFTITSHSATNARRNVANTNKTQPFHTRPREHIPAAFSIHVIRTHFMHTRPPNG